MTDPKKPLVTIVTITHNLKKAGREKYFQQSINSVRSQTYTNIEHIIVDGASTDGTLDLIKEYARDSRVTYFSEPDTGIYDAMNKGVRASKGKYVGFLNSDDYYHGNRGVEESVRALEDSNADFSFAPASMINEDGSIFEYNQRAVRELEESKPDFFFAPVKKFNEDGSSFEYKHPHCIPDIAHVFYVMPFCHQTMFTKRSVFMAEKMFDTNFKSAGDYDFVLRLCLKKYKSILVDYPFVTYRLGGLSDANQKQSKDEVAESYFVNYSKLLPIDRNECEKIYCCNYRNFPLELAWQLKDFEPYFNYEEYLWMRERSLQPQVDSLRAKLESVSAELAGVYASREWRAIIFFRRLGLKVLPAGSYRRKSVAGLARGMMRIKRSFVVK